MSSAIYIRKLNKIETSPEWVLVVTNSHPVGQGDVKSVNGRFQHPVVFLVAKILPSNCASSLLLRCVNFAELSGVPDSMESGGIHSRAESNTQALLQ